LIIRIPISTVYLNRWNYPLARKEMHLSNVDTVRSPSHLEVPCSLPRDALLLTLTSQE
jgi:hypothetical protein